MVRIGAVAGTAAVAVTYLIIFFIMSNLERKHGQTPNSDYMAGVLGVLLACGVLLIDLIFFIVWIVSNFGAVAQPG